MDSTTLVESPPIEIGRRAADAIQRDDKLQAVAVFWWYDYGNEVYRLAVASKLYAKGGPRSPYLRIHKLLNDNQLLDKLSLADVWAIPRDHWTVKALQTVGDIDEERRFTGYYMNNVFVQDAYVYFLRSNSRGR